MTALFIQIDEILKKLKLKTPSGQQTVELEGEKKDEQKKEKRKWPRTPSDV